MLDTLTDESANGVAPGCVATGRYRLVHLVHLGREGLAEGLHIDVAAPEASYRSEWQYHERKVGID